MEFEALKKVAATVLGMDPEEIEMDMTFLTDLGADSLDLYQIFMGVEEETGLHYTDRRFGQAHDSAGGCRVD